MPAARRARMLLAACALTGLGLLASAPARAGLPAFCARETDPSASEQDRVLRFAGAVRRELANSGSSVALVARAGLDLHKLGLLYSHAGIALRDNPGGAWAVRQLYYACDEGRPRLFDQGLAGFALGAEAPQRGHIALIFLPEQQDGLLAHAALDKRLALSLLAGTYSANAYAFSTRYQNCNGWVAELLASALGPQPGAGAPASASAAVAAQATPSQAPGTASDPAFQIDPDPNAARSRAQAWLRDAGYQAGPVRLPSQAMVFAAQFVPLVQLNDHPLEDLYALALRVNVPESIAAFVQQNLRGARRVELCHDSVQIVVRRGWEPIGAACRAGPGDELISLTD